MRKANPWKGMIGDEARSSDHYPCMQPVCLEKKFQVFPSEMDLRAHMVSEVCQIFMIHTLVDIL